MSNWEHALWGTDARPAELTRLEQEWPSPWEDFSAGDLLTAYRMGREKALEPNPTPAGAEPRFCPACGNVDPEGYTRAELDG